MATDDEPIDRLAMLLWALPAGVDRRALSRAIRLAADDKKRPDGAQAEAIVLTALSATSDDVSTAAASPADAPAPAEGPATDKASSLEWKLLTALAVIYGRLAGGETFAADAAARIAAAAVAPAPIALEQSPLANQWQAAELRLALAALLGESGKAKQMARMGRAALSLGLDELLDGRGLPHAQHLPWLRPLLASWTRCRTLETQTPGGSYSTTSWKRYQRLVRSAVQLSRADGRPVFAEGRDETDPALLGEALRLGGDEMDHRLARSALRGIRALPSRNGSPLPALPRPSAHSQWAATAVLRSAWSRRAPRIVATYAGTNVRLELAADEQPLLAGDWAIEVRRDGQLLAPAGEWEETCWVSDKDVDYLELQLSLAGDVRVQRHIVLSRADDTAMLADAVLGSSGNPALLSIAPAAGLAYRSRFALAAGARFQPAAESREGYLASAGHRALVLPLALREWRTQPSAGELAAHEGCLTLTQQSAGANLYAPLWFDLNPRRLAAERTWRQLTVGEGLHEVAAETAVGYRVAVERRQWLIYRALSRRGNRTLLGHNLSTEMLVAQFDRRGEVHPLIEVE